MKFRSDFVTNSSSSSFIVESSVSFPAPEGCKKNPGCKEFSIRKRENRTEYEDAPKDFDEFADYCYLYEGINPTVSKMCTAKKLQALYARFLEKKYGGTLNEKYITSVREEWRQGYGESKGNDLANLEGEFLTNYLHPFLQPFMDGKTWIDTFDGQPFVDYCIHYRKEKSETGEIYLIEICDEDEIDCTSEFFAHLYRAAGNPDLPQEAIEPSLRKMGLSERVLDILRRRDIQVIWAANKTKKADMAVLITKRDREMGKIEPFVRPVLLLEKSLENHEEEN